MLRRCHGFLRDFLGKGTIRVPGREGFTLVEILMVLVILSIGILPIAMIQNRARSQVSHADVYTRGVTVGQAQLERIKQQGFGNIVNEAGVEGPVAWNSTVTNLSFGLDRIDVAVTWQEGGAPMNITFSDLVSMR